MGFVTDTGQFNWLGSNLSDPLVTISLEYLPINNLGDDTLDVLAGCQSMHTGGCQKSEAAHTRATEMLSDMKSSVGHIRWRPKQYSEILLTIDSVKYGSLYNLSDEGSYK